MPVSRRNQRPVPQLSDLYDGKFKQWPIEQQIIARNWLLAQKNSDRQFKLRYRDDPVAFAHDCIDWGSGGPTPYQDEIWSQVPLRKRVSVRGPHTLGKTALAAILILWWALTRNNLGDGSDWKVLTTASVARQLTDFLWPEIHKWAARVKWDKVKRKEFNQYELMSETLKLSHGRAIAMTATEETGTEGGHADHLLYVFDEAKAIVPSRWDAAEGALMGGAGKECFALAISTPGEPTGRFYDIQTRKPGYEDWWVRHVTIDECIAAGRATPEFVEQRKRQWGENSAVFKNRVLGEFCASDEDCVIPLEWIEAANERWRQRIRIKQENWNWVEGARQHEWPAWEWRSESVADPLTHASADIARSDLGDNTSIARRHNTTITQLDRWAIADTMPVVGRMRGILERWAHAKGIVDVIGIGAGPFDHLREIFGKRVRPFNASERAIGTDRSKELEFVNKRSHAWWNMRELLDPAYDSDIALPPCDVLTGDLTAVHRKKDSSSGKIAVESKDEIRKRLGRSTDDGDSVVAAFYPEKKEPRNDHAHSYGYREY